MSSEHANHAYVPDAELQRLVEAYINGSIEGADFAALESRLQDDADARHWFRRYSNLDAALCEYAESGAEVWVLSENPAAAKRSNYTLFAALAALAASLLFFVVWRPFENPVETPAPGVANEDGPSVEGVGILSQAIDAEWEGPSRAVGDILRRGRLRLKSGVVRVEFYCGATVILEGPADLELVAIDQAVCHNGKLRAWVPPHARGFRVITPEVELIDLGTEFGLSASESGPTEVHVFAGKVELLPQREHGDRPRRELLAGNGLRFDPTGEIENIALAPEGFMSPKEFEVLAADEAQRQLTAWQQTSQRLRKDPRVLVYYDFQRGENPRLLEGHSPAEADQNLDGVIIGCQWVSGRWPDKPALEFNRPTDRVRVEIPGDYQALTYAMWVRVDALEPRFSSLLLTDGWNPGAPHWQLTADGKVRMGLRGHKGGGRDYDTGKLFDPSAIGRWMHLAVVMDCDRQHVTHYVDGRLSQDMAFYEGHQPGPLHIGRAEIGNWGVPRNGSWQRVRHLIGRIDEFVIFREALSGDEIQQLYEAGRTQQ